MIQSSTRVNLASKTSGELRKSDFLNPITKGKEEAISQRSDLIDISIDL